MQCPWGKKALTAYLGTDSETWTAYDSCKLIQHSQINDQLPILIDQGEADGFLAEQLKPEHLTQAAGESGYPIRMRMQAEYDHSYFFVATFIEDHLRFHADSLAE